MDEFEDALRWVINELKAPKEQFNSFGNYKFRNAEDILEAVKPLLFEKKLRLKTSEELVHFKSDDALQTVELTDSKGKQYTEIIGGDRYYIKSTVTVTGYGKSDSASAFAREEQNKKGMDGAQVTGASSSYAKKYALNDLFDIDDSKDADHGDNTKDKVVRKPSASSVKPATYKQRELITRLFVKQGVEMAGIPLKLEEDWGIPVGQPLTMNDANTIIQGLTGDNK